MPILWLARFSPPHLISLPPILVAWKPKTCSTRALVFERL